MTLETPPIMNIHGKAFVYGDDINTDLIIAGKYTKTLLMSDLAEHCLEDLDTCFLKEMRSGDIIVAGRNFGCGSSREQAPLALRATGVGAVVARSYARIFYRNAINIGLPLLLADTADIVRGDTLRFDAPTQKLYVNERRAVAIEPVMPLLQHILAAGGLVPFLAAGGRMDV